jgi:FtsP/CotA-like multicopper oxidase with cupredoxin domain
MDASGNVMMVTLNNRSFMDTAYQGQPISKNTLEVWEFANATVDTHPIHLHLVQFQVLNRQTFNAAAYRATAYGSSAMLQVNTGAHPPPSPKAYLTGSTQAPAANERLEGQGSLPARHGHPDRRPVRFDPRRPGGVAERLLRRLRLALPHPRPRGQRHDAALPHRVIHAY